MSPSGEGRPVRVLRVIARLNVGGPALHVTYLARGLAERGYETTLVAGDVARGEASMSFVAEQAGVEIVTLPGLSRELSPVRDALAAFRLARLIRKLRPDVVHTHTAKAGAVGRTAALLAWPRRPVVVHTFHGHVLRGYFGTGGTLVFRRHRDAPRPRLGPADRRQPRGAGRAGRAPRRAAREVLRRPPRDRARAACPLRRRPGRGQAPPRHPGREVRRRLVRPDDGGEADRRSPDDARRRARARRRRAAAPRRRR